LLQEKKMRFFRDFPEAINEIRRELKEMGIMVHPSSVQNMDVTNNPDYETLELQNYQYLVTSPDYNQIPLRSTDWAEAEFDERTCGLPLNPGSAWELRAGYWKQFLVERVFGGKKVFDYAYPERMASPLAAVIDALKKDPNTRRAYLSVFDRYLDPPNKMNQRIPCTLGYHFLYRQGQLNVTYLLRSSDFFEHFNYDIYLADRLKCHIAEACGMKPGTFSHWVGSLHCFSKNVAEVF
jgi:thymidylate synthase-like protein